MGIRVSGPQVVSFLHWLQENAPEIKSLASIRRHELSLLAKTFRNSLAGIDGTPADFGPRDLMQMLEWRQPDFLGRVFKASERLYSGDLLERYRAVPFHGLLLFSSQDVALRKHVLGHWDAWNDETGETLDFYDYCLRVNERAYSFSIPFIKSLHGIPGAKLELIAQIGLPCFLIWSRSEFALVPFGDVAQSVDGIRERLRAVLRQLARLGLDAISREFHSGTASLITPDIFVSYSHNDMAAANALASHLKGDGFDTWIDQRLSVGSRFDLQIGYMIERAKATVAIWSNSSVSSKWVRAEALYALDRSHLAPVAVEWPLSLPPPFNAIHTLNFSSWPENREPYRNLLTDLSARIHS